VDGVNQIVGGISDRETRPHVEQEGPRVELVVPVVDEHQLVPFAECRRP
jgi:hypothetical protein